MQLDRRRNLNVTAICGIRIFIYLIRTDEAGIKRLNLRSKDEKNTVL